MDETVDAGVETEVLSSEDQAAGVETEDSGAPQNQEDNTDWKALFEKEHTAAENYKTALQQKRQLRRLPPEVAVPDEEDDKPLTRADLRKALNEEIAPVIAQNKVDTELEKQVKDPEKRKLVKLFYETRVRQMGTSDEAIRNDISAALAIADAQKLRKAASEITRKQNMQTTPPLNGSSSEGPIVSKNHKFSPQQVAQLTATAQRLGADPKKFVEDAWKNQNRG